MCRIAKHIVSSDPIRTNGYISAIILPNIWGHEESKSELLKHENHG